MKKVVWLAAAVAGWSAPALGQGSVQNACASYPAEFTARCIAVAQAAEAAQPRLGILVAGGNPTLGTASTGGARLLGVLPRVNVTVRANLVLASIPDITGENEVNASAPTDERTIPTIAFGGTASMPLLAGASLAPTVGGVGAVDLLASATYIPFDLFARDVFKAGSAQFALGAGARIGLLRESLTMPGVSVTLMYRTLGGVQVGNACANAEEPDQPTATPQINQCRGVGEVGEATVGASGLSGRAAVSKSLLGFGLAAGVGYDRWSDDAELAVRGERRGEGPTSFRRIYRTTAEVETTRWSVFGNASYGLPLGSVVLEGGWMQGGERMPGFIAESDYDPESGVIFGSVGVRLSL